MDKLHLPLVISLIVFLLMSIISTSKLILPVYGFSVPNHKQIVGDALPFLNDKILKQIDWGQDVADWGHQFDSSYHFDNCNFQEGTDHINQEYTTKVIPNLDPTRFGVVLHTSMDFYAHSNWVNMGKTSLIDDGDGLWKVMRPGDNIGGAIVLEGEAKTNDPTNKNFLPYPATVDLSNPQVPMVHFGVGFITEKVGGGKESLPGLITGVLPSPPYSSAQVKCPLGSIGHWDSLGVSAPLLGGPGLAKDTKDAGITFYPALNLAKRQVAHEWCRLVNLVKQSPSGDAGVSKLYNEWVKNDDDDQDKAQCTGWKGSFVGTGTTTSVEGNFDFKTIKPYIITPTGPGSTVVGHGKGTLKALLKCTDNTVVSVGPFGFNFQVQGTFDPRTEQATLNFVSQSPDSFSNPNYEKAHGRYSYQEGPTRMCGDWECPNGPSETSVYTPGVYCGTQNLVEHRDITGDNGVMIRLSTDHVTGLYDTLFHLTITVDKIDLSEGAGIDSVSTPSSSISSTATTSMLTPSTDPNHLQNAIGGPVGETGSWERPSVGCGSVSNPCAPASNPSSGVSNNQGGLSNSTAPPPSNSTAPPGSEYSGNNDGRYGPSNTTLPNNNNAGFSIGGPGGGITGPGPAVSGPATGESETNTGLGLSGLGKSIAAALSGLNTVGNMTSSSFTTPPYGTGGNMTSSSFTTPPYGTGGNMTSSSANATDNDS
jgi:hypothetical protein